MQERRENIVAAFTSPNWTQIPNDLFEIHLATMKEAELRVLLVLLRQTVGYHRTEVRYKMSKIAKMTGMSESGVRLGVEEAEAHGFIERCKDNGVTLWTVKFADDPHEVDPHQVGVDPYLVGVDPHLVGVDPHQVDPHLLKKEVKKSSKEKKKETPLSRPPSPAKIAADARKAETDAVVNPYIGAYLNGTTCAQESLEKLRVTILTNVKVLPPVEDFRDCAQAKRESGTWSPYNPWSGFQQVLDDYGEWCAKGRPTVFLKGKPRLEVKHSRRESHYDEAELEALRKSEEGQEWSKPLDNIPFSEPSEGLDMGGLT
jgi:hypothetical protein